MIMFGLIGLAIIYSDYDIDGHLPKIRDIFAFAGFMFVCVAIISLPFVYGGGYLVFYLLERNSSREPHIYIVIGLIIGFLIPVTLSIFGGLTAYTFWRVVVKKYLIKQDIKPELLL